MRADLQPRIPAAQTPMPRPHPVMPRVAHHPEAPPRDLFVPAVNERVGMNDRGRPSGSPLRHPRFYRAGSMASPLGLYNAEIGAPGEQTMQRSNAHESK